MNEKPPPERGEKADDISASGTVRLPALLAETTAVQALGTMAVLTIPALAPAVAAALNVPTSQVGYQISAVYFAGMLVSLVAGTLVARFGPWRSGQIAMLMNAAGCLLASVPNVLALLAGSLVIGAGYGLINPAASELLVRHTPPERRNLIFSIKQTGVPLGGMAAGLLGPSIALAFGWQVVLWGVAGACILAAGFSQVGRAGWDMHRGSSGRQSFFSLRALKAVLESRSLRWLAMSSFCFSAVQLCVIAFLVALLVEDLGFDLVAAGVVLAAVQASGAVGRMLWGVVADRVRDGMGVLLGLACTMTVGCALLATFDSRWPGYLAVASLIALGLSAVGWNGIYLSEIARLSRPNAISATTGAAMFFTFTGVVFGPAIFSMFHDVLGSYLRSYGFLACISLAGALMVLAARSHRPV